MRTKVLYVDQFSKTEGNDTIQLIEKMNRQNNSFIVEAFFANDTQLINESEISTKITYGFIDVYKGSIFKKIVNYLKGLKRLQKYVVANKIDILHLQWFSIPWLERFFVKRMKKICRIIITVHDVVPFEKRVGEKKALNSIYKNADVILVHNDRSKNEFLKRYKTKAKICVIPDSFCDKSAYSKLNKNEARRKLNIPENAFVVLNYGRIRYSKGVDLLIEAMESLSNKYDNIFLLIGGSLGSDIDVAYYKEKAELFNKLHKGRIDLEFINKENERLFFSSSDVLCLPYRTGWQSGIVQLGLVYDLPIISSNLSLFNEAVLEGVNGIKFDLNKDGGLEKAIYLAFKNKDKLERFSEGSHQIYIERFSLDHKALEILDIYGKYLVD